MCRSLPSVTVVVPSFNQGRFIREALDSILDQAYPNLDVLVMDGNSTDGTVEILREYGERIRFVSGPDSGQSDALNRGFEKASGEIVAWLNSDDRYCRDAIVKGVSALVANPAASMVYGEAELIGEDGTILERFPSAQTFDLWKLVHVSDFIMQPTVFMRAAALREVRGLDASLEFGMDWDLWIRLACRGEAVFLDSVIAQTREYADTKTASGGLRRWRELRMIMKRHGARGWSPGVIAYGLDTLRRNWPRIFGPSTVTEQRDLEGHVLRPLFVGLHRLVHRWIIYQTGYAQGVFIDGWVTDRAFVAVPWDGRRAILGIEGEIPAPESHIPFEVEGLAGAFRGRTTVTKHGPFRLEIQLEQTPCKPHVLEVKLRTSRFLSAPGDSRRLAFRLSSVGLQ
jgi:glycosyltransferase involved in cell wall biosynthesis